VNIRPYVSVGGVYDTALGTVSVDSEGRVPLTEGYGVETRFGVAGSRTWRTTELDIDYRGSFRHYNKRTYFDAVDSSLTMAVSRQVSRHVTLELGQSAALYHRSFFLPTSIGVSYDPLMPGLTGNELYDSPTRVLATLGRITYQWNARTSVSAAGAGFLVRRRSAALNGVTGYMAIGDIAHRLSRHQTIGVDYALSRFDFTGQFGESELHGVTVNYAARLSRNWELALRAGGYRVHSLRLVRVELDPAIAVFFGQSFGVERFDRSLYAPHWEARLTRGFRGGSWALNYARTVTPGNGVYLTSNTDHVGTSASYQGSRRVSFQAQLNYSTYSSLTQSLGKYHGAGAGGGVSVLLTRSLSLVTRVESRRYDVGGSDLKRTSTRATIGLAWSPGDYPLSIW